MNGDVLTTLDYRPLVEFHQAQGATLTVAMHSKQVDIDLGVIEADGRARARLHREADLRYQVSMGIYVYEARALHHLPEGPCQFPDLVHRLLAEGEVVAACETDADWYDIGTVSEYERAAADVERNPEKFHLEPLVAPSRDIFAAMRHLRLRTMSGALVDERGG